MSGWTWSNGLGSEIYSTITRFIKKANMARTVDEQEYAQREQAILETLKQLIFSKGYERLTISDMCNALGISSGALFHYFKTKKAMLEALVEQMQQDAEATLQQIVDDPQSSAVEKFQGILDKLHRLRAQNRETVLALLKGWYTDENAIVRQKIADRTVRARAPLLSTIITQGTGESVFRCSTPELTAELILSLLQGMENAHARTLLSYNPDEPADENITSMVTMHSATMEAIERILGAEANCLRRIDVTDVASWFVGKTRSRD